MVRVHAASRAELEARRNEILAAFGTTYDDLAARAERHSLVGDEWPAWTELREIGFLLGDDD